jgi:uncharacterized membrane protein
MAYRVGVSSSIVAHRVGARRTHVVIRLCAALGLLCALSALAPPVRAQDHAVVVERRDGDVTIARNGDVRLVETWTVRFIGGPFHDAFRAIPLTRVEGIDGWGVAENGQAFGNGPNGAGERYFVVDNGGNQSKITWYFSPTTDQTRTFTLSYTLHGALRIYGGGDQFFWKFVESDRQYPLNAARVIVHLPAAFPADRIRATTYLNGHEHASGARRINGDTISFQGGPFAPGQEWEIRTQFPHGAVTATAPTWQVSEDRQPVFNLVALVVAMLALIGGFLGVVLLWFKGGRDRPVGVAAEYDTKPPDESPPGVAGALIDEKADMQDIVATLVDLSRRGYMHIVEQHEPGLLGFGGSADFLFVRDDPPAGQAPLRPYEQTLLDTIFGGSHERRLSDLRAQFYRTLPALKDGLFEEMLRAGFFTRSPAVTRRLYLAWGIGLLVLAGVGSWLALSAVVSAIAPLAVLVPVAVGLVALGVIVVSPFMPKRTPKGAAAVARWRAFRRYLAHIDRYTQVDQATDQFERYLPYAIAFGLEQGWVKAFAAVNTPAPRWYWPYGYYPYSGSYGDGGRSDVPQAGRGAGGGGRAPSLDEMARGSFSGLTAMSSGFFTMLSSTAAVFDSRPAGSGGGSSGGWSGGGSGGGGGGGGGSSGFG